ncbi:MAG: hypothetical protein HY278_03735 [candidate division NC10 bacterium]|nr:hypothetical protein [candidate division NC10 bacterium]
MKSTSRLTKGMFTILLGLMVVVFASDTFAQGTWTTKAPMPTARVFLATGVINGHLYAVGGSPGLTANEVYDPVTNTWAIKASAPTSRIEASAAGIAGKLYVVGGCINSDCRIGTTNILEVYDEATDSWATKAAMPTASHQMAIGAIGGKLYVVGGDGPCPPCNTIAALQVYDPATDTWATKAAMPAPRHVLGAGEVNGILYAVSGALADDTFVNTVEAYDPATDSWTTVAPIPTVRTEPQPQGINGVLYVAGSGPGGTPIATLEAFTPVIEVAIDITPGSFPNSINPRSLGVVPVAILTTGTFDATTVDPNTVRFGRTGTEAAPVHFALQDVDGDGDIDLILQFNTQDTGIVCGETSASLTGQTFGGQAVEGSDSIRTVPCK